MKVSRAKTIIMLALCFLCFTGCEMLEKASSLEPNIAYENSIDSKQETDTTMPQYSCLKYTSEGGKVRITYLESDDSVLVFPNEIDGKPVYSIGETDNSGEYLFANKYYDEVVIPQNIEIIQAETFRKLDAKKITIENKKIAIGECAFAYSSIKEIDVPNDFEGKLGTRCFEHTDLTSFNWPKNSGEDRIGLAVFQGCKRLENVSFPNSEELIYIPEFTFIGCSSLKQLTFPMSTKKVKYLSSPYADNFPEGGVKTLKFIGLDTELDAYPNARGTEKKEFITIGEIIAPKGSRAIEYAKNAKKIRKLSIPYQEQIKQGVSEDGTPFRNYSLREHKKNVQLADLKYFVTEK